MPELLFALLELLLEFVLQAAFEFGVEIIGSLVFRGIASVFDRSEFNNPVLACIG